MTQSEQDTPNIGKQSGVTQAERYLAALCSRSFLSLWSYSCLYRDQGQTNHRGDGKELCDLLVVFGNHILIFSDKDCDFKEGKDIEVGWSRWYRNAVKKSAEQIFGAERWIKSFPDRIHLDRECKIPFPIDFPAMDQAIIHRIVVAHGCADRCQEVFHGSGSLMLENSLVGDDHLKKPFVVGIISPKKGYVHVFDDTSLNVVMGQLDTTTDFIKYLTKKEALMMGEVRIFAAGEEELLARYLAKLNDKMEHDFVIPNGSNGVIFGEGAWLHFLQNPQRIAQLKANEISYYWDSLVDKFAHHAIRGTQYFPAGPLREQEPVMRILARADRTKRRMLSEVLRAVIDRSINSGSAFDIRMMLPSDPDDPYFVFMCVRQISGMTNDEYRIHRKDILAQYCHVVKHKYRDAQEIVGFATESGIVEDRSEDLLHYNGSEWTEEDEDDALEIEKKFGFLQKMRFTRGTTHEYPVDHLGRSQEKIPSRNSKCTCKSGKRYRYCCGRKLYPKKKKNK